MKNQVGTIMTNITICRNILFIFSSGNETATKKNTIEIVHNMAIEILTFDEVTIEW